MTAGMPAHEAEKRRLVEALRAIDSAHTEAAREASRLTRENTRMRAALIRLRDCDWTIGRGDRMDPVRDIARIALLPDDSHPQRKDSTMPGMPSAPRIPIPRVPHMTSLPAPPWHREHDHPMVILDRDNHPVATVAPPHEIPHDPLDRAEAIDDRRAIAQAITGLPALLDAARAALTLLDPHGPPLSENEIAPIRTVLRASLRRIDGLMPDGTPPPPGTLP